MIPYFTGLNLYLSYRYANITGFHAVSSKDAKHIKGFTELLPRLLDTLQTKRLIGFTVPPSWFQVIIALRLPLVQRSLRVHASLDYCSWSTFQMLAQRLGVTEGFEQLIGFLNERGIVAYMGRDERNPLRDWVFISPTWLLTVTRKLVRVALSPCVDPASCVVLGKSQLCAQGPPPTERRLTAVGTTARVRLAAATESASVL